MRTYLFTTVFCLFLISCGMEEIPTYKLELTVSPSEGGKLNVSPSLPMHPEGSTVTITPEPNEHWVFKQWEGDGSGSSTPLQLIMDSNKSVVGIFIKRDYPLKITINGEGTVGEKIIPNPSGREYPHGTKVELTPIPKEGWLFDSWGGELSGNEVPKAILVDKEKNVTVNFKRRDYPLNITITGEGTVEEKIITNPNGKIYPFQTVVQLIPKPKDGWLFDSWGGDLSGKEQTKNITVDKEKNVAVKFVRKQPTFTLYKESYLNQRSGVAFWWYAGWGFGSNLEISNGYFSGGQSYHDVNGDGFQDILTTHWINDNESKVQWFINDGKNEKFKPDPTLISGDVNGLDSFKILKTDVNNDGIADFILLGVDERIPGDYSGNFTVIIGKSNGTFESKNLPNPNRLWFHNGSAGDLNGDGFVDVLTQGFIWWGNGTGNFTNSNFNISDYYAKDVLVYEILDINKDGWNDLILGSAPIRNPTIIVLNNKGIFDPSNIKIELPTDMSVGINDLEIIDIDSDGDLDIVEIRGINNKTKLHVYINTNLNFTLIPNYIQNSEDGGFLNGSVDKNGWSVFKFDDLDADGKDEIVMENFHDGYNSSDNNLVYNCLKKIDGVWKKTFIKY